ncbi:MAG: hypothetical protein ACYCY1_12395 [Sulfuriferula sp.]
MSEIMTQSGTLPVGVEVDGVVHRDFELRPQRVRDSMGALADPRTADPSFLGLAMLATQFMQLGTLDVAKVDADMLLDMYEVDMQVLMGGAKQLRDRLKTFRDAPPAAAPVADSAA